MDPALRIVTSTPLEALWNDNGPVAARRIRQIDHEGIRSILRIAPLSFVVADIGARLEWIEKSECFRFWKEELQSRLATGDRIEPWQWHDGYCYVASLWEIETGEKVVLVELHH
ncbi:MAG: hypothetical protein IT450_21000 [Phycisphaerales bacterium]|nr:hypothetical protein [Phycisphaerales bacterium]